MIITLIKYGDPILHNKCKKINKQNNLKDKNNLKDIIIKMFYLLLKHKGVGLAATQIGLTIRLFLVNCFDSRKIIILNPSIVITHCFDKEYTEGCLSIPKVFEQIKRKENIFIEYVDINWYKHKVRSKGFLARVILHEFDHLNGILFLDYLYKFHSSIFITKNS
ncbi:peptide deformylase [Candidatus Karelsulcia muelleri]|nr:peptide deformylase [Candidatus Karelsulcia muelleri]WDI79520.1 peptide deformylase [Candidatus Karelsulcia muelleri]